MFSINDALTVNTNQNILIANCLWVNLYRRYRLKPEFWAKNFEDNLLGCKILESSSFENEETVQTRNSF